MMHSNLIRFSYLLIISVFIEESGTVPNYATTKSNTNDTLLKERKGRSAQDSKTDDLDRLYLIVCGRRKEILTAKFDRLEIPENITRLRIFNCIPPTNSYVEVINRININIDNLTELILTLNENQALPPGNYTKGLRITKFTIDNDMGHYRDIFRNAKDFLEPLVNVTYLEISNIHLAHIPESMKLKRLRLKRKSSLNEWGNCKFMEKLIFENSSFNRMPIWPDDCKNMKDLKFKYTEESILFEYLRNLTALAPNLVNLTLSSNALTTLPPYFRNKMFNLERLNLSDNKISEYALNYFPVLKSVSDLDVSKNALTSDSLKLLVSRFPGLRKLKTEHKSNVPRDCGDPEFIAGLNALFATSIEDLSIYDPLLDLSCFPKAHFANLTSLGLEGLTTSELHWRNIPTTSAPNLTVDFSNTNFTNVHFNETDYKIYQKQNSSLNGIQPNIMIVKSIRYIGCDCRHGWLARALRDFPDQVRIPGLRCDTADGIDILKQDRDKLECDKWTQNKCVYTRRWGQTTVDAECGKGYLLSTNHTVRGLNLSSHDIVTFYEDIPSSVAWLDYRNNRLSTASAQDIDTLFVNGRRVWLSNNHIICDCDNRLLLDAIHKNKEQVQDFGNLTCIGTGQKISEVDTYVLCQTGLKSTFIALGVLVFIALAIVFTIRRHNEEIRMFLFARGWFLVCLRQEDLDDKPYDAFISFSHEDENYIRYTLLPGLENAEEEYRVCVHYRDWEVGDWIPAQIMRSVKLSKRTIIVLSRSFIASPWSALEFRYALANANQDNKSRVLILVLDDVLSEELDPELQGYLSYNTYLSCDDPWFWEKLRYAMPHRNDKKSTESATTNRVNQQNINLDNLMVSETNTPLNSD